MRVAVDERRCQGNGACVAAAPAVFELGPGGTARPLVDEPGDAERRSVTNAARRCPTRAIRVSP